MHHLSKGDTETRQAGFEASGGLQLIQHACRPLPESVLQLVLCQLHAALSKGDTETRQAGFEASGGLQLIQQLGEQGHPGLAHDAG